MLFSVLFLGDPFHSEVRVAPFAKYCHNVRPPGHSPEAEKRINAYWVVCGAITHPDTRHCHRNQWSSLCPQAYASQVCVLNRQTVDFALCCVLIIKNSDRCFDQCLPKVVFKLFACCWSLIGVNLYQLASVMRHWYQLEQSVAWFGGKVLVTGGGGVRNPTSRSLVCGRLRRGVQVLKLTESI